MGRVIENKYDIEDIVYLKTDEEQLPRLVFAIIILQHTRLLYRCSCGTQISDHYDFEMSKEKDVIIKTTN